jgi:DNA-3-methyladenine glycosylase II
MTTSESSAPAATAGTQLGTDLDAAYDQLVAKDRILHRIERRYGRPDPFTWAGSHRGQTSNFESMMLHIVSQQISTAVAFVLFDRIRAATPSGIDPAGVVAVGRDRLHAIGLSRAKASYLVSLAELQLAGVLNLEQLDGLDDEHVSATLTAAPGIGPWTAQMFLISQLRRPDVLPAGDLAIRHAVQVAWNRPAVPTIDAVSRLGPPMGALPHLRGRPVVGVPADGETRPRLSSSC